MNYSPEIDYILREELTNLIDKVRKKEQAFEPGMVEYYYQKYMEIQKNK